MTLARYEHAGAAPATGLAAPMGSTDSTFMVLNGTDYPTGAVGDFVISIDPGTATEEKILCSARSTNTFTVATRGYDNTVAAAHSSGTTNVQHVFAAAEADDDNAHIYVTSRDDHTQYARTDGTRAITGEQVFSAGWLSNADSEVAANLTVTLDTSVGSNLTVTGTSALTGAVTTTGAVAVGTGLTVGTTVAATGIVTSPAFSATGLTGATAGGRYVGATTSGSPATGTFLAGDFVVDLTGAIWTCITGGSPGTWADNVGILTGSHTGPASQTDAVDATVSLVSSAVALVSGYKYQVTAYAAGNIVSATPNFVQYVLADTGGYLPLNAYLLSMQSGGFTNGSVVCGSLNWTFTATSTASDTFTLSAIGNGSGALRTAANNAQFTVVRVG